MMSLLHRGTGQASERLEVCCETVHKLVEEVRASYAPDIVDFGKALRYRSC
ncbi:hypothetical protein A2U01_0113819 [Trifolium medium]|uniref:Uncharacterized protein n=1 Tax=Trifolium medium TaxID=97028 RepID=A0A392VYI6_9FABA|nr:hypothetical protein [Trifolium medium]